ncbi:MAG: hypothetical protein A3C43_08995 [Candidatus Schekmanbacteria bacterium RIFCSPHIGHO2_02_FULL_38_11]|uniref:UspA domain-containing protein n=1 Tax=Candidatus Schekmanbacteria bacterium RIFCSPLOWO2_12_FULL_38_15 TaxID=1817883 RepID=A0A1F7SLB1_9BACT|nr:MAG: hypothetical protein A2043_09005 [Candidatus Schekmanbacteria bacterium GWA2_38_9]OGL47939.1 MAG: hypothetical protein A3H37_07880 [Candidatus Schekmanbacteria bacterium RIFCSPLOWO2_02_FULL_38_14]OGL49043.1 MAG: hypothetical protein A3C43_08995 [Candidatus Schekmanbacteria bacterium RIFCSPHIGHO2_02_FULL_38_11]OGL54576.1 MAG: hypothetical protein A3G31_10510 [Candidatus Schekmanbacteria bacterium RIFCSPLOWO2_12_FULL_38_15]
MKNIERIVVPVDFSSGCINAFNLALSLAKKNGSKIYILHIVSEPQVIDPLYASDFYSNVSFDDIRSELEKEIRNTYIKGNEGTNIEIRVLKGYPVSGIIEFSKDVKADLIVMATHARKGLSHAVIGSVAEKVLRTSPCPVLTVKLSHEIKPDKFDIKKILVPVDLSEHSEKAFELAVDFASLFNANIDVLNVIQPISFYPYYYSDFFSKEGIIKRMEEEIKVRLGLLIEEKGKGFKNITHQVRVGEPFHEILEKENSIKADLIIMGTHGRTGISHALIGSVAERLIRLAKCPVMTVK